MYCNAHDCGTVGVLGAIKQKLTHFIFQLTKLYTYPSVTTGVELNSRDLKCRIGQSSPVNKVWHIAVGGIKQTLTFYYASRN